MAGPIREAAIAFEGPRRLAEGSLLDVALSVKRAGAREHDALLVFNAATGRVIDLNLSGGEAEVRSRYAEPDAPEAPAVEPRGPGRPKLGVVAKEVTLLPRHWEWLAAQPGGASVTLRKLIDGARRSGDQGSARAAQEAVYQFIRVMAGNLPLYEEATRALFASDTGRFTKLTQDWPTDVRDHARRLATSAFDASPRTV